MACGGEAHRLGWADGRLHALDHPDAEGERTLVALGGGRPECLAMLDAWDDHADDLRLLTLGPRHDGDRPVITAADVEAVQNGPFATNIANQLAALARIPPHARAQGFFPPGDPDHQKERLRRHLGLLRLFTLPVALQRRLCATVADVWLARSPDHPVLHAALVGRARPDLRQWAGGEGKAVHLTIGPAAWARRVPDGVTAQLPTRWLVDVWGRGQTLVDGWFGLGAVDAGHIRAVGPDGMEAVRPVSAAN